MPSPSRIPLDQLLAPLPGENPCGQDLRYEAVYEEIKHARREGGRDALGVEGDDSAGPQWTVVVQLASDALSQSTKDLMIAAWLTEALVALYGFAGLRDGLILVRRLLDEFWDGVYPLIDGEDIEPRVAPLVWLTDAAGGARLPNRLRDVPLTQDKDTVYSWNYWNARYPKPKGETEDPDAFARRKVEAEQKKESFEEAVGRVETAFIVNLHEDLKAAQEALRALDHTATERFGDAGPGVTAFRKALEDCEALVGRIVKGKGGGPVEAVPAEDEAQGAAAPSGAAPAASGPIRSRVDAFQRLRDVSNYLRLTEPQSPVPLLIDRAIAWGQMPFDQLLAEMIKDATSRAQVGDLLGIKPAETNT